MIRIQFIAADGSLHPIEAATGQSLMKAATEANLKGIEGDCGGSLTCATCHVMVEPAWLSLLPPPVPDETDMLDFAATPATAQSRLACQIALSPALDGMVVRLPVRQY
jgi:ferredoxin, 2Fe-2S